MMAKDQDFSDYYSTRNLTKTEFYSVMDTLYELNNLWMMSEFIRQNRQILFREVQERMRIQQKPDFTEICNLGKDTMLSRLFQVMNKFNVCENVVTEDVNDMIATHRIKAYAALSNKGKAVPQIVLQGKWVERWGFAVGTSVRVECYQNKLVVLKED